MNYYPSDGRKGHCASIYGPIGTLILAGSDRIIITKFIYILSNCCWLRHYDCTSCSN